ncbi:protein Mis18-alpha [Periophthalmus magnuspinnatus]|uniref:protein Mis18-alpha n=1 Tax=Periophthalmus magnuspinnatus TaxID=409849 RepID=UPI00243650F6|nr:protein Mis18-alpha [Periophthalmus magnuspinnatus]
MATRKKISQQHPNKSLDDTFDVSTNPSGFGKKLFERDDEEADDDGPAVFICGKCKIPVGDSFSWAGTEDSQNQIRLKKITDNVAVGKEKRKYGPGKKSQCLVSDLICQGCLSVIGMVYSSTPRQLDHKRFIFCLNVADIDSYVLGSANQTLPAEGLDEQPVTLEYRASVERQLKEMKLMIMSMAQKLEEMESGQ